MQKKFYALLILLLVSAILLSGCTTSENNSNVIKDEELDLDVNINNVKWFDDSNLDYKTSIFNEIYSNSKNRLEYSITNYSFDITSNKVFKMKLVSDVFNESGEFVYSSENFFNIKNGRQILQGKNLGTFNKRGLYKLDLKGYDEEGKLVLELENQEVKLGFDYNKYPGPVLDATLEITNFSARETTLDGLVHSFQSKIENKGNTLIMGYLKQSFYLNGNLLATIYSGPNSDYSDTLDNLLNYKKLYYVGLDPVTSIVASSTKHDKVLSPDFGHTAKEGDKVKMVVDFIDLESGQVITTFETPEIIVG